MLFNPIAPSWTTIGNQRTDVVRDYGMAVLEPLLPGANTARVFIFGGAQPNATTTVEVLDASQALTVWNSEKSLFYARRNANSVILPDGKVFMVGGNMLDDHDFPVFAAELFDPFPPPIVPANYWPWTQVGSMDLPRVYHSTALLLPDGRVWVAGTELEPMLEIYHPGYLFEGSRPTIDSAPTNITYGSPFTVGVGAGEAQKISSVALIRAGSVTHGVDMGQRYVGLTFGAPSTSELTVTSPANANIAPPGYYMLFIVKDKQYSSSGQASIPSVAKWVRLS